MKTSDKRGREEALIILPPLPSGVEPERRKEIRCATDLPLQLTSGSGETIPAVIHNLSAGGLLAKADERFSLLLPPPNGSCFTSEFFLDDVEVRNVLVEIVWVERYDRYLIDLGCRFLQPPPELATNLRVLLSARRPRREARPHS